jgi:tetratricopeptide (TPR) repeat protein
MNLRNQITLFLLLLVIALSVLAESPAETKIAQARVAIDKSPNTAQGYNDLALALARRARETSDTKFYSQAEEALKKSFVLSPGNFEGEKVRTWVLLGKHEFRLALESAKALNQRVPDDLLVYGYLVDANVELGNYKAAENAAQWMLNLRPGNVPGLTRAAYLRELFGDIEGAKELMRMAYNQVPSSEVEDRAWILTQTAHLEIVAGRVENAEWLAQAALELFPDYHYALYQLAQVRQVQRRHREAVDLLQRRYELASHPENLYAVAHALEMAGKREEARAAFLKFEQKALAEAGKADNSNHELVYCYADSLDKPVEALRIARLELARRQDFQTLAAYAWALYRNGNFAEAHQAMMKAISVGVRDAMLFYRAGEIAWSAGAKSSAERYWREATSLKSLGSEAAEKSLARTVRASVER